MAKVVAGARRKSWVGVAKLVACVAEFGARERRRCQSATENDAGDQKRKALKSHQQDRSALANTAMQMTLCEELEHFSPSKLIINFSSLAANFRIVLRSWDISSNAEIQTQASRDRRSIMVQNNLFPHEVQNGKQPQRAVKITHARQSSTTKGHALAISRRLSTFNGLGPISSVIQWTSSASLHFSEPDPLHPSLP
jgi:hypothetical protein